MTHFNLGSGEKKRNNCSCEKKDQHRKKKLQCRKSSVIKWEFQPMISWSGGRISITWMKAGMVPPAYSWVR